jgi:SAM-dependent methyltransferase
MSNRDRERLRQTFGEDAALYDRARPGYPPQLFEDLSRLADIGPGSRVLEIGCGTGQATVPLVERGGEIVAVELGPAMAAVARRQLARFPSVTVIVSAFEDWPLPPRPFDTVIVATAFHWLDPEIRVTRVANALRPGGALATIATLESTPQDAQPRWLEDWPSNRRSVLRRQYLPPASGSDR